MTFGRGSRKFRGEFCVSCHFPGSYGAVAEAIDHVRGTRVAIKQIRDVFGVFENAKRIYREISVLRNLDHENVIKLVHLEMPKWVGGHARLTPPLF